MTMFHVEHSATFVNHAAPTPIKFLVCLNSIVYIILTMFVEKIELIGFKSFADRTLFHFHPGITCIVGPNGCGKSNIVDAFRWVLGEQSAKSLRGEKMEEVIFNGSTSKKPRGMAEVTLFVSGIHGQHETTEGTANGDLADTVSVTRRLYRSGESEYLLNKRQCRLKDIKDLFLDTGLVVKSYSILEQDRIAEILNSKPFERRFLIEEVAGVMKYNVRKKEAIAKLESSRANLERINDIMAEVRKQIALMDRLAKKAEKYKKLITEIHAIELKIAKNEYETIKSSFQGIIKEYQDIYERETVKKADLSTLENEIETRKLRLTEEEKTLEQIEASYRDIERKIAEFEKTLAVARTERDNFHEYLGKLHSQQDEYQRREEALRLRKNDIELIERDLSEKSEKQQKALSAQYQNVKTIEEELEERESLLEGKRRQLFKISEELSNLRNSVSKYQSALEGLQHREESALNDADTIKKVLADLDASLQETEAHLFGAKNETLLLRERKERKIAELAAGKDGIERLRERITECKEEYASYTSRIESLREIIREETEKDVKQTEDRYHILASVADVLEVEDDFERAIESALTEKIYAEIMSSYDDIVQAVNLPRRTGWRRTSFIPLKPLANVCMHPPEGTLGSAVNFIKTKEEFRDVAESLLANVFIVPDVRTGIELLRSGHRASYVTTQGVVIEPNGVITAGEIKGVFTKKREIREAEIARDELMRRIERLQEALTSAQKSVESSEAELKAIESAIGEKEREISILKLTEENFREEKERRSRKLAYLSLEVEQISRERESIERQLTEDREQIERVESKKVDLEKEMHAYQEEIALLKSNLDVYRAEVTDLRLAVTALTERIDSVHKEKESIIKELHEHEQKMTLLSEEITSTEARIRQRADEMLRLEGEISVLVSEADTYRRDISARAEKISDEREALHTIEQELKSVRSDAESLAARRAELDIRKTEHTMKMQNLSDHVRQNYGLALDIIDREPVTPDDERRLTELREKIKELGTVNLGTLDEYEELQSRYEFLRNQKEDLDKSIAELEEAITKINATTRKKLREAFEGLRVKFAEVFQELFAGGRAELVLTDENNILETGIDIIAQPPGKRLQNINLLSGGEKTLTALSLLFASFLIKPTPLCILDEADSALDEFNTDKFAAMVRELAKNTQFIVVTHNKNTMAVADYIYGITMEEAGVSKVISMQLVEAA